MKRGLIGLGFLLAACGAEQQDPQCVVARATFNGSTGSFAATYQLKPGQDASSACAQLTTERVGLQKYLSEEPGVKDSVALRSKRVGDLLALKIQYDPAVSSQFKIGRAHV